MTTDSPESVTRSLNPCLLGGNSILSTPINFISSLQVLTKSSVTSSPISRKKVSLIVFLLSTPP